MTNIQVQCAWCLGGGVKYNEFRNSTTCPVCAGTGFIDKTVALSCQTCKGSGKIFDNYQVSSTKTITCPTCNGVGTL